jgi:esterase/lipase
MNHNEATQIITGMAELLAKSTRTPLLRRPDEYGMAYQDVFFPSLDGTVLEGWFIPAAGSNKLIIANHPLPCNRYGYPGHMAPWDNFGGFEVNFLHDYKHLHDAGYNVLAYDLRNHGTSAAGSGGIVGIGLLEYRDVVGSLQYVKSRADLAGMEIGLLSRCLGANSSIVAMAKHPEHFADVKAMVAVQPVSLRPFVEKATEQLGLDDAVALFDATIHKLTGYRLDELSPLEYAKQVRVPTLVAQVREDSSTKPEDVQHIYDNLAVADKKLLWIEGTTRRFDGYNYFGEQPAEMLAWFNARMGR